MKAIYYVLIPIASIVNAVGQAFLKLGAEEMKFDFSLGIMGVIKSTWKLIVGLFFFGLTFILTTVISKKIPITTSYPIMTGLTFVLLSLIMVLYLKKEDMSLLKGLGMFVVISGIILMSMAQAKAK
jgi:multidrug transporter EmrE-like cation transporter